MKVVKVVGVQLATGSPFPHLSLTKEAELRTQIQQKKKKSHKVICTRLHPILKKAQVRETEPCLTSPGLASSLRKGTKPWERASTKTDWSCVCQTHGTREAAGPPAFQGPDSIKHFPDPAIEGICGMRSPLQMWMMPVI